MSSLRERLKRFRLVRKLVYAIVGMVSYPGLTIVNRLKISGTEHLRKLPKGNVLFVSNHQTYFADVITFLHIFCAVKWRKKNRLGLPYYLLNPFTNVFYVAAEETMKASWVSRLFAVAGALTVKRTWNNGSAEVRKRRGTAGVGSFRYAKNIPGTGRQLGYNIPPGNDQGLCSGQEGNGPYHQTEQANCCAGCHRWILACF